MCKCLIAGHVACGFDRFEISSFPNRRVGLAEQRKETKNSGSEGPLIVFFVTEQLAFGSKVRLNRHVEKLR